jgi:hypothetical protein
MAIVHVAFKSSSKAPPAAAHAQYIARDGQYERRGGVELVESGNMPEFAKADPQAFWVAADAHERANGRTYTEIQIALPRELGKSEREELAREVTRELMGDRFAYTMAVHVPLAKDNIDQPHMHLMFSERAVDPSTRGLAEDRFFKRNGAKKDPAWNDRNKPEEVREKWVETMNRAMERAGQEQRLDARSYVERGRHDLDELKEPKLLGGEGHEAAELREHVQELRRQREELPAPHLDQAAAVQELEKRAEAEVARIEQRRDEQISILDKLIEKARELAQEVKERATEIVRNVADLVESFFGAGERGALADKMPAKEQEQARPPTPQTVQERIEEKLSGLDRRMAAQESIEDKLANLDKRLGDQAKAQQEKELSQKQQIEISLERGRGHGHEL